MPTERGDSTQTPGGSPNDDPSTFEQSTLNGTTTTGNARLIVRDATQIDVIDTANKFVNTTVEGVLSELEGASDIVNNVVADKAAAQSQIPVAGVTLYILSDDGKGNIWQAVTGAAPGAYSDDGGSFCGTVFIPAGGDGSSAWVRDFNRDVNASWFGFIGDESNETVQFISALTASIGKKLYISSPVSKYKIDTIEIPSNIEIYIEPGSIFEANTGFGEQDELINIIDKQNIVIYAYNVTFKMLKAEYTTGEWRHVFNLRGSTNIWVFGLSANDSGGDGFYIGATATQQFCENIHLIDISADNNKRQGISLVSGKHIRITNPILTNTTGTSPATGIDIEPNSNDNFLEDIIIDNPYTEGNDGSGINISLSFLPGAVNKTVDIKIINPVDKQSNHSLFVDRIDVSSSVIDGEIIVEKPVSIEPNLTAVTVRNYDVNGPSINIYNPLSIRPNESSNVSAVYGSAFVVYRESGDTGAAIIGNVHFHDIKIKDNRPTPRVISYIFVRDLTLVDIEDVTFTGKISAEGISNIADTVNFYGAGRIDDLDNLLNYDMLDISFTLSESNYVSLVNTKSNTVTRTVTLDTVPAGWPKVTFEVSGNQSLRITPDALSQIFPGSNGNGKYIQSLGRGSRVTLFRKSANEWFIEEEVGAWTREV